MPGTNGARHPAAQPPAQPSLPELQAQFEAVRDGNQERLGKLSQLGAVMDPLSFLHARIDALIESISQFSGPNGPRWAVVTRLQFEQSISAQLDEIEREATKSQLAQGGLWTPGMIAEYARKTGLFQTP